jgi:hypothetical protein
MPLVLFLPLLSLVIYFIPIYLLRRRRYARAQDYFVASGHTPPGVIRNSSVAYALKLATFGPFFAWGASGDFWPPIINSVFFGVGVCLIYILRRPMLAFMESALAGGRSITVHELIARQHGNDPRVRLLASGLTIFAILALTIGEALVLAAFLKPVLSGNVVSTYAFVCGLVALTAVYAIVSGNAGVMRSAQSQLGMCYLGLFGAAALLLYLMISALRPMTPHSTLAVGFVAACCAIVPLYRRSRYMDTGPIRAVSPDNTNESGRGPFAARLFLRTEKILNVCISVFAAWIVVVAGMQLYSDGFAAAVTDSIAALATGTRVSSIALAALVLLPLFHPLVDMSNWQRIAVFAKDAGVLEPSRRPAAFRGIVRVYAVETPLISLFMCMFGVIGVVTMATPDGANAVADFLRELSAEQNALAAAALSLLLLSVFAIALSTMSSLLSASLCTVCYDVLPAVWPASAKGDDSEEAMRRAAIGGGGLYVVMTIAGFFVADAYLQVNYTSGAFLALLFAFSCAQLSFVPLILGPLLGRTSDGLVTVSSGWALVILACGAAAGLIAVAIYLATGSEPWLWAAVPACLASGLLLFTVARLWQARTAAGA